MAKSDREKFLELSMLAREKPREFARILKNMTEEESWAYERERLLVMAEIDLARKENRLH